MRLVLQPCTFVIMTVVTVTNRTNDEWLADLRQGGEAQAAALEDLRAIILQGLPYAIGSKIPAHHPVFFNFIEEITQEALLRVLHHLDSFEGRSKFTTWVYKIAIRLAFSELRRRRWQEISLDAMAEDDETPSLPEQADLRPSPEQQLERRDWIQILDRLMQQELTTRQRQALQAIAIQGMPMEEVARRMGMQRNAFYKLLHDARRRLKQRMEALGMTPEMVLSAFEH